MCKRNAIEGDYIETKKDNLIFDVKGIRHPKNRRICFIRFYPTPEGDRVRNKQKYLKIYNLKKRYEFLRTQYPKYLFYSPQLDLELQGVKLEDIKKVYTPRTYFEELMVKKDLSIIEQNSYDLCELFIKEGNLPEDSIGISGSPMVGLNKEESDIDLLIYGTQNSLIFQNNLKKILSDESNEIRRYTYEEFKDHYQWRAGGSGIAFKDFLRSERRKLHQGKFRGIEFFIRYIKSPEDWKGDYNDYKYKNFGRIRCKVKITDARDSIFTPCEYTIEPLEILDLSRKVPDDFKNNLRYINSFRGRFCEHAKQNEIVLVQGKLEKVFFKKQHYFRILLTDQIKDSMIIQL